MSSGFGGSVADEAGYAVDRGDATEEEERYSVAASWSCRNRSTTAARLVRISAQYGPSVYSNRLYSAILGELGVDQPPAERVEGGTDFDSEFSLERLPELDADVLLVRGLDEGDGEATNQRYFDDTVRTSPLWDGLAAVRADQAHVVTGAEWNSTGGFEAAHLILDDLEETLVGADAEVFSPVG